MRDNLKLVIREEKMPNKRLIYLIKYLIPLTKIDFSGFFY